MSKKYIGLTAGIKAYHVDDDVVLLAIHSTPEVIDDLLKEFVEETECHVGIWPKRWTAEEIERADIEAGKLRALLGGEG